MGKLSITVMLHPKRAKFIPYLKEKLGDIPIIIDTKNNLWDTCRRAWLAQDMTCEYGVVIQDDAIICDDFKNKAEALLKDDLVYSFFAGYMLQDAITKAEAKNEKHIDKGMIFNEIALCMKTKHIPQMVKYCDDRNATNDQEITKWAKLKGLKIRYPIPSLIDHRDEESIYRENYNIPKAPRERKAFRYIDL